MCCRAEVHLTEREGDSSDKNSRTDLAFNSRQGMVTEWMIGIRCSSLVSLITHILIYFMNEVQMYLKVTSRKRLSMPLFRK